MNRGLQFMSIIERATSFAGPLAKLTTKLTILLCSALMPNKVAGYDGETHSVLVYGTHEGNLTDREKGRAEMLLGFAPVLVSVVALDGVEMVVRNPIVRLPILLIVGAVMIQCVVSATELRMDFTMEAHNER